MPEAKKNISPDSLQDSELLSAKQACEVLGVKPATLYTYVSRGKLHPVGQSTGRESLYLRQDVLGLKARSESRLGHGAVAASAMRWGQPVINTSITEITSRGPKYRGYLATELATYPGAFEGVAELLWSGVLPSGRHTWPVEPMDIDVQGALDGMHIERMPSLRMMRVLAIAATSMGGGTLAEELRSGSLTRYSRQLIFAFVGCCGILGIKKKFHEPVGEQPIAAHIVDALGMPADPLLVDAINAALIVGADHELSPATFAARIAASVGAGLHACVVAALATQVGSTLGGGCDQADQLLRGFASQAQIRARVDEADRHRERLPGFALSLYPDGDPRAVLLIELAKKLGKQSRQSELAFRFIDDVQSRLGIHPNIEVGLAMLCLAGGLPERTAGALWGIGRSAGWIAHVLEQRLAGFVLRPRGSYAAR